MPGLILSPTHAGPRGQAWEEATQDKSTPHRPQAHTPQLWKVSTTSQVRARTETAL